MVEQQCCACTKTARAIVRPDLVDRDPRCPTVTPEPCITLLFPALFPQVPLYAVNQHLVTHTFQALDVGGTIVIHAFGAFYGLAASFVISYSQVCAMHRLTRSTRCDRQSCAWFWYVPPGAARSAPVGGERLVRAPGCVRMCCFNPSCGCTTPTEAALSAACRG